MLHELIHEAEFWVAISSVLTFAFLIKKAWGPIVDGLDRRTDNVRSRLAEAENLYLEAEKLMADYQERQKNVEAEVSAILDAAQRRAETIVKQAETDMQRTIAHQEAAARLRIERAERDVIEAIREAVVKASLSRVQAQLEHSGISTDAVDKSLQSVSKSFH